MTLWHDIVHEPAKALLTQAACMRVRHYPGPQASQQAEAAKAAPRKRTVVERVFVAEEDLRRSGR